jgi:hypothetical protein
VNIARVFPRRTRATPTDPLAFIGEPGFFDEPDGVYVSVTFTWDLPEAERIAKAWARRAPTKIGGPATGMAGGDFEPGKFLREGYVITSRGCPNRCWFCSVPKREGDIRELPIRDGWNVLDDNLLACSEEHVRAVFDMLERQRHPIEFTGGLEAARLKRWHAKALRALHPKQLFFAYDEPEDRDPLHEAGELLLAEGFTTASHALRAYVLIGYPGDSPDAAEARLKETVDIGFTPMAMFYRNQKNEVPREWWKFRRLWSRPAAIHGRRILCP